MKIFRHHWFGLIYFQVQCVGHRHRRVVVVSLLYFFFPPKKMIDWPSRMLFKYYADSGHARQSVSLNFLANLKSKISGEIRFLRYSGALFKLPTRMSCEKSLCIEKELVIVIGDDRGKQICFRWMKQWGSSLLWPAHGEVKWVFGEWESWE